jgi:hypothetical protein
MGLPFELFDLPTGFQDFYAFPMPILFFGGFPSIVPSSYLCGFMGINLKMPASSQGFSWILVDFQC